MAEVRLEKVSKSFGDTHVIPELSLEVRSGEFMVLVGPSGCGKSTILRLVAGLEDADVGAIYIGGARVDTRSPKDRGIAMVFQSYALYPHMTVRENMAFSLKLAKLPPAEITIRVEEAAKMLDLGELLDRKPNQLSGGQKQRVAIGRAMVRRPVVFLFDEPLSNLDAQLRVRMRAEISLLHRQLKSTIIYVTHDQVEAMTLADRIAVVNRGRIEQVGAPLDVYHSPKTKFVASFIGTPSMNFFPATVLPPSALPAGAAECGFRAENAFLTGDDAALSLGEGRVILVEPLGGTALVHVEVGGRTVVVEHRGATLPKRDALVNVQVFGQNLYYFDSRGSRLSTGER